jgi:hypothetical protein
MPSIFDDPAHWHGRAQEVRIIANQMKDPEAKRTLLNIAVKYDMLAQRVARSNKGTPKV